MPRSRHVRFFGQYFVDSTKKVFCAGCTLELDGYVILVIKDEDIIILVLHTGNK